MDENFPDGVADTWRYGHCYAMAKALAALLDWPVGTLTVTVPDSRRQDSPHVVHAWVRSPDGRAFDAGGFFDEADLHEKFLATTSRKFKDPRIEEHDGAAGFQAYLDASYGPSGFWDAYAADFARLVTEATGIAESHLVAIAQEAMASPRM
jgi:hypothetical protein